MRREFLCVNIFTGKIKTFTGKTMILTGKLFDTIFIRSIFDAYR